MINAFVLKTFLVKTKRMFTSKLHLLTRLRCGALTDLNDMSIKVEVRKSPKSSSSKSSKSSKGSSKKSSSSSGT